MQRRHITILNRTIPLSTSGICGMRLICRGLCVEKIVATILNELVDGGCVRVIMRAPVSNLEHVLTFIFFIIVDRPLDGDVLSWVSHRCALGVL